jgi:GNAT superfamily N-acetyltransferase
MTSIKALDTTELRVSIEIREESPSALADYSRVPIAFEVRERLAVLAPDSGLGGLRLVLEPVGPSYWKDYDALPGHHPTEWPTRFECDHWGILAAHDRDERVGGAVVVFRSSDIELLDGRTDLAVLWDLRVAPAERRQGIGGALFRAAEEWARQHGAEWLKVETQNINVAACRFYARQGCTLGAVHRFAYPDLPEEVQLLWYKPLGTLG